MRAKTLFPALLLVAITTPLLYGQTNPSATDMDLARQLYYASPSKSVSDSVGNGINMMIENIRQQIGRTKYKKEIAAVRDTMHAAFSSERIHARIVQHLAQIIAEEPEHAPTVAEWLRTPETSRIRALDTKLTDDSTSEKFLSGIDFEADTTKQRMNILLGIQRRERLGEQFFESSMIMTDAVPLVIMRTISPSEGGIGMKDSSPLSDSARKDRIADMESLILVSRLYTYRTLTEMELIRYGKFFGSDAGRWYADAVTRAINAAYRSIKKEFE